MALDPGHRVLITAGASGIGRAVAEGFAAAGARVWVTDVDKAALATCPDTWHATHADVVEEDAMAALDVMEPDAGAIGAVDASAAVAVRESVAVAHVHHHHHEPAATSRELAVREARAKGYSGDPCPECANFTLVRNGTCLKCDTCGSTTGCS